VRLNLVAMATKFWLGTEIQSLVLLVICLVIYTVGHESVHTSNDFCCTVL